MRNPTRRPSRRPGVTWVETAIAIAACLLFLLGIFEFGRVVMIRHLIDNAAREAARQAVARTDLPRYLSAPPAALDYDGATRRIQDTAHAFLVGQEKALIDYDQYSPSNINVFRVHPTDGTELSDWYNAAFGQKIGVRVSVDYKPILPGVTLSMPGGSVTLFPDSISLTATAVMRCEGNY